MTDIINTKTKTRKEKALDLRRKGLSYSEILKEIKVAKSTLSLWLRDVGLAKPQKQRITQKRIEAALRGASVRKKQRLDIVARVDKECAKRIGTISKRELFLIGIALYWAEGSKEKQGYFGSGIKFSNSDPKMIQIFIKWLLGVCKIPRGDIGFEIYIHENSANSVGIIQKHWSQVTRFPEEKFGTIYFKRNHIKTNRRNTGDLYYGLLRVKVRASSLLYKRISGWIKAINENVKV